MTAGPEAARYNWSRRQRELAKRRLIFLLIHVYRQTPICTLLCASTNTVVDEFCFRYAHFFDDNRGVESPDPLTEPIANHKREKLNVANETTTSWQEETRGAEGLKPMTVPRLKVSCAIIIRLTIAHRIGSGCWKSASINRHSFQPCFDRCWRLESYGRLNVNIALQMDSLHSSIESNSPTFSTWWHFNLIGGPGNIKHEGLMKRVSRPYWKSTSTHTMKSKWWIKPYGLCGPSVRLYLEKSSDTKLSCLIILTYHYFNTRLKPHDHIPSSLFFIIFFDWLRRKTSNQDLKPRALSYSYRFWPRTTD